MLMSTVPLPTPGKDVLEGLLERVKEASGPDREIDREIQKALDIGPTSFTQDEFNHWPLRVTKNVDAALALVERVLPGFVVYSFGNGDLDLRYSDIRAFTNWRCGLAPVGFSIKENPSSILQWSSVHAATAPLAILSALLSALIAQVQP
jgi:hypothetical protein